MDITQAQTRLRKTFKYPSGEDDDDTGREDLDEQQQEQLISSLQHSATLTDAIYTRVFTVLPLVALIPFFFHFTASKFLPTVLSIASLSATAWLMHFVPPTATARSSTSTPGQGQPWYLPFVWPEKKKSAEQYINQIIPWGILSVSMLLCLGSYLTVKFHNGQAGFENYGLLLLLPGLMFGVVSAVRQSMSDVQRGVGELEGLKYGYKGA